MGSTTQLAMPAPSPTSAERRSGSLASGRAKAITASDIAIAPPQRVTRYVLLYRGKLLFRSLFLITDVIPI
jgi:hypothetical protein